MHGDEFIFLTPGIVMETKVPAILKVAAFQSTMQSCFCIKSRPMITSFCIAAITIAWEIQKLPSSSSTIVVPSTVIYFPPVSRR